MHRGCHGTTAEIAKSLRMSEGNAKNDHKGKTKTSNIVLMQPKIRLRTLEFTGLDLKAIKKVVLI